MAEGRVRIGTSGWNYPSGAGTWNGVFYPPKGRAHRPPGFDELGYYATHFDTVEVNSTFYRIPSPEVTRRWVQRTPQTFEFSIKLYQKFTHPKMFADATGAATTDVTQDDVDLVRASLEPVQTAGKLGALLAQFPPSFKRNTVNHDYLGWLLTALEESPVAVELRHRSWSDDVGGTLCLLNNWGAAWVQIDEPKFRFSIEQNYLPNVTSFYYMRLHGRNADAWWTHERAEDRYDYLYSAPELKPIAETADAASRLVKKSYVYLNNHFAAKAVANTIVLKHQLGIPVTGEYRPEFISRYPEVAGIVDQTAPDQALLTQE